jgi:hypothetical protein
MNSVLLGLQADLFLLGSSGSICSLNHIAVQYRATMLRNRSNQTLDSVTAMRPISWRDWTHPVAEVAREPQGSRT